MTTKKDFMTANRWIQFLKTEKKAHKYDLMRLTGTSFRYFEVFKPWFLWQFSAMVAYDKKTKEFEYVAFEEPIETEQPKPTSKPTIDSILTESRTESQPAVIDRDIVTEKDDVIHD